MGLWELSLAGSGFLAIGAWQAYSALKHYFTEQQKIPYRKRASYKQELIVIALIALAHLLTSAIQSHHGLSQGEFLGSTVQMEKSGVASIFLLYSLVGIISEYANKILPIPTEFHDLVALFALCQEYLVFYLPREGSTGLENRYHALMLVPIGICIACKGLEIAYPCHLLPPLGLALGLVMQGLWLIQMGVSFFTRWITQGCRLAQSYGGLDYTVECGTHHAHRGMAVATLQFNCHMAVLLLVFIPVFSLVSLKYGKGGHGGVSYRPLGHDLKVEELNEFGGGSSSRFALDSDEEEDREMISHGGAASNGATNGINGSA